MEPLLRSPMVPSLPPSERHLLARWGGTAGVVNQAATIKGTATSQHQGLTLTPLTPSQHQDLTPLTPSPRLATSRSAYVSKRVLCTLRMKWRSVILGLCTNLCGVYVPFTSYLLKLGIRRKYSKYPK